jgi:hypothetical protein
MGSAGRHRGQKTFVSSSSVHVVAKISASRLFLSTQSQRNIISFPNHVVTKTFLSPLLIITRPLNTLQSPPVIHMEPQKRITTSLHEHLAFRNFTATSSLQPRVHPVLDSTPLLGFIQSRSRRLLPDLAGLRKPPTTLTLRMATAMFIETL